MKPILCTVTFLLAVVGSTAWSQSAPPSGEKSLQLADASSPASPVETIAAASSTASTPATNSPVASSESSAAGELLDLIEYVNDAKLTAVIQNLARRAGLNYVLDPKIGFGQPGPNGIPVPEPTVNVRWEKVTAEQALLALLNNFNLQIIQDPKTKIARITAKDPAAPDPLVSKIIQLKYASPSNILGNVQVVLGSRSRVVADIRTSQLVVLATEKEMADVDRLVEKLDTQTRQVLIEARLLETLINPSSLKGINWQGTLQGQNVTFGNGIMSGSSSTTLPGTPTTTTLPSGRSVVSQPSESVSTVLNSIIGNGGLGLNTLSGLTPGIGFLNADGVRVVMSFLNQYGETKVISTPRTVTLDNERATIEVGTMYPIVSVTAGTANTTGGSSVSYSNLTVRLDVTPRISANSYVYLRVNPKVVRLGDQVSSVVGGVQSTVDSFQKREIDTTVMIPSGNTLVMGGLIEDNVQRQSTKVPLLGDIPGLGPLFRSDSKRRQKSNLIMFLTPTIVQDSDFQPTTSDYLKTPVPTKDSVEPEWSSWDSGKAKDWSKPAPTSQDQH
jgi:type II secretory pathway component GspD/PulD (secretin)